MKMSYKIPVVLDPNVTHGAEIYSKEPYTKPTITLHGYGVIDLCPSEYLEANIKSKSFSDVYYLGIKFRSSGSIQYAEFFDNFLEKLKPGNVFLATSTVKLIYENKTESIILNDAVLSLGVSDIKNIRDPKKEENLTKIHAVETFKILHGNKILSFEVGSIFHTRFFDWFEPIEEVIKRKES